MNFKITPTKTDREPVNAGTADKLDILAGRKKGEIYNARALKLDTGQWLMRIGVDPFRLYQDFGGTWFEMMRCAPDDPALADLEPDMTVFGPSPSEVQMAERQERERRQRQEDEEAHQLRRKTYWRDHLAANRTRREGATT